MKMCIHCQNKLIQLPHNENYVSWVCTDCRMEFKEHIMAEEFLDE